MYFFRCLLCLIVGTQIYKSFEAPLTLRCRFLYNTHSIKEQNTALRNYAPELSVYMFYKQLIPSTFYEIMNLVVYYLLLYIY